jgi:signal transduction histidine kinase
VAWLLAAAGFGVALAQWRARAVGLVGVRRAAHELRGPITAARLGLQLGASTGELSAASLRALDLELGRAGLALDDLSLSALGAAPRRVSGPVDVVALLEDSVLAWQASARLHGAELRLSWIGRPAIVSGDRLRLAQVTGNLIANAIEHAGGEISVVGTTAPGVVRIEVRDTGPGLPAGFEQRQPPGHRQRGSLHGHGLAIVARIIEQHGGRLSVADRDRGASIMVELPIVG